MTQPSWEARSGAKPPPATKATPYFTREEIRHLTEPSDWRGLLAVAADWTWIGASLTIVALWPNVLTVGLAVVVLAGRQLGLAILTHEASHRVLCKTRWLNDVVGKWLCGAPVWLDLERYRTHHLAHHLHTGTAEDPDMGLVRPYPTNRADLVKKLGRDLLGWTGIRRVIGQTAIDFGFLSFTVSTGARPLPRRRWTEHLALGVRNLAPVVCSNGALLLLLWSAGHPTLYLLWLGSYLTTYSVVLRVRAIAEHACTPGGPDMLENTRTTRAGPLARLLVAPHHVNYHVEHHLLMTVPFFRLPEVHARLREMGVFGDADRPRPNWAPGYLAVLRLSSNA